MTSSSPDPALADPSHAEPRASTAVRGRSILVTGASGFIGAQLCARLLREGARVQAVSRTVPAGARIPWHAADLSDASQVARVLDQAEPSIVFHLAGFVAGTRAPSAIVPMLQANCVAGIHLLSLATERKVERIVLAGSLEEPREAEPTPTSPYAAAKWALSGYARMFHALYGTPAVIARIFMTYGPDQPDYSKLVPYLALALLSGKTPLLSSGRRLVDWIYIDDLVSGLLALGTRPGLEGQSLDLGSGQLHSVAEVTRELFALLAPGSEPPFGTLPDRALEIERVADVEQTARLSGFRAQVALREGLARTVEHYRAVARGELAENELGLLPSRVTSV